MSTIEVILSVATLVLGGGNVAQFLQVLSMKRKNSADAYLTEIQSLRNIIDGNVSEIKRLQIEREEDARRYDDLKDKYIALEERFNELRSMIIQAPILLPPKN